MQHGLSNRVQAALVGVSAGFGAFGTAAAAIPDFVPVEYKVPIAVTVWLAGIVGFSVKETQTKTNCSTHGKTLLFYQKRNLFSPK